MDNQEEKPGQVETPIWRVVTGVPLADLEHTLNELAAQGYQVFKMDRYANNEIRMGQAVYAQTLYDIIAFDPMKLGMRSGQALADTIAKLSGLSSIPPGAMRPIPGVP